MTAIFLMLSRNVVADTGQKFRSLRRSENIHREIKSLEEFARAKRRDFLALVRNAEASGLYRKVNDSVKLDNREKTDRNIDSVRLRREILACRRRDAALETKLCGKRNSFSLNQNERLGVKRSAVSEMIE